MALPSRVAGVSDRLPPSLLLHFDASVRYGEDNATPTSAAVGFVVGDGREPLIERSVGVEAFVSSAHLEYRALLEAVRAVEEFEEPITSLHVHGDADAVIDAVDPRANATPGDRVMARRVDAIRAAVADIPTVTYRAVGRGQNERAHTLARAGHERTAGE
jgi:ribonuclease HI